MVRDTYKGGRRKATHCKLGHELTDDNRIQRYDKLGRKAGSRCKICSQTDPRISTYEGKLAFQLKSRYNINSISERDMILESQNGKCAICGTDNCQFGKGGFERVWHIDHKHNDIPNHRGILCARCNLLIGKANDDPVLLRKMADYIESYK